MTPGNTMEVVQARRYFFLVFPNKSSTFIHINSKSYENNYFTIIIQNCLATIRHGGRGRMRDSDNPDNRIQEGIEISGILTKTVENGTEIKYPTEITPFLTLRKDLTFEGDAVCNSIKGDYKYSADNGQFKIEGLIATELGCTSPHHEAETMYLDYFRKISSFKQDRENVRFYFGENSYLEYKSISEKK